MENDGNLSATTAQQVTVVGVKLPIFWPADPTLWFIQAESQFNVAKVTSSRTKFDHVVSVLPHDVISEVRDIIVSSSSDNDPYKSLKEAIIQRTASSERDRLQLLMSKEELEHRKPTQMLRRMQQLLGAQFESFDKSLLKELFLQKLPSSVQRVLASMPPATAIDQLAETADRVSDIETASVATVHARTDSDRLSKLEAQVAELLQLMRARKSPTPHRHGRASSQRPKSPTRSNMCFFHEKFGTSARKCQKPCSFNTSSSENN